MRRQVANERNRPASKRGARVEMNRKQMSVDLPKTCNSCKNWLTRAQWLRCNTCADVNLCLTCVTTASNARYPCLDNHTFTAMFRVHELSLRNDNKHDQVLKLVMQGKHAFGCIKCNEYVSLFSWIRCNDCVEHNLCMKCWVSTYHDHCRAKGVHTFTNMTQRYRELTAPTCAMLCEEEQTLAMVKEAGVDMSSLVFNSSFDRAYCSPACSKANTSRMHTLWTGNWAGASAKFVGYYCPAGWRRFALLVHNDIDFENSVTVYHGTRPAVVAKIFKQGLLARTCQHKISAAYVSPSIIYCAHPRYARVMKMRLTDEKYYYIQFVAELRANLSAIETRQESETLHVGTEETIDANFPQNESIELLLRKEPSDSYVTKEDGLHMTGVLVRVLDHDPMEDTEAWWWTKWRSANHLRRTCYMYKKDDNSEIVIGEPEN